MFQKIKNYFLRFKQRVKFCFLLISNPKTRESGLLPIIAIGWALLQLGGMIFVGHQVAKFLEGDPKFFFAILEAMASFLFTFSQAWVAIASNALDAAIQSWLTANITGTATSLAGWVMIRDLANMFIVLGFVVVGIAFTLRLESYGSKKVLKNLILIALLINFSPLICGIIIDTSNILVKFLLASANPNGMIMEFKELSNNMVTGAMAQDPTALSTIEKKLAASALALFLNLMIIVSFFTYAVLIIARYVMLNILFMFSPLAFICYIFPFTQQYAKTWWDNFLKWCFMGVVGFFFIWFATKMLAFWQTTPEAWGYNHVLVIFVILMAGYKFTKASSAMGASMAIGLVSGVAGYARGRVTGGAKKLGGWGMQKLRGAKPEKPGDKEYIGGAAGRFLERLNLRKTGTTATNENARVSARQKEMEAALGSGNATDKARVQQLAKTGTGVKRVAALGAVISAGQLHETFKDTASGITDLAAIDQGLSYANSFGAGNLRKEAAKKMPALEALNKPVVQKIKDSHPRWTTDQAQHEAVVRAVVKMPEESLDRDFVDSVDHTVIRDAGERMTKRKRETLKKNTFESVSQERKALAPNRAARAALTPELLAKWRDLAGKERAIGQITI